MSVGLFYPRDNLLTQVVNFVGIKSFLGVIIIELEVGLVLDSTVCHVLVNILDVNQVYLSALNRLQGGICPYFIGYSKLLEFTRGIIFPT